MQEEKITLDLITLSDMFRRHAVIAEADRAAKLVKLARVFAALTTHYRPEYPDMPEHRDLDSRVLASVRDIASLADGLAVERVVLPHTANTDNWVARRVGALLAKQDFPVEVVLQTQPYCADLSTLGPINRRVKTALDQGVRGVMDISSNLAYRWDR